MSSCCRACPHITSDESEFPASRNTQWTLTRRPASLRCSWILWRSLMRDRSPLTWWMARLRAQPVWCSLEMVRPQMQFFECGYRKPADIFSWHKLSIFTLLGGICCNEHECPLRGSRRQAFFDCPVFFKNFYSYHSWLSDALPVWTFRYIKK